MVKYSFLTGLLKTVKNGLIFFAPAIIAFLSNVPPEYGAVASLALYLFKNWYETTRDKKLF